MPGGHAIELTRELIVYPHISCYYYEIGEPVIWMTLRPLLSRTVKRIATYSLSYRMHSACCYTALDNFIYLINKIVTYTQTTKYPYRYSMRLIYFLVRYGYLTFLYYLLSSAQTFLLQKNAPSNVEEISLAGTIPEITNNLTRQQQGLKPAFVGNLEQIMKECVQACETVSRMQSVQALLNSTQTFDLVIVEVFGTECFLPLGQRFEAPVVGLLSSVSLPWVNAQLGNPDAPAYVPSYMMGYGQKMNLWERFANTMAVLWANIMYKYKSQMPSQVGC